MDGFEEAFNFILEIFKCKKLNLLLHILDRHVINFVFIKTVFKYLYIDPVNENIQKL